MRLMAKNPGSCGFPAREGQAVWGFFVGQVMKLTGGKATRRS